MQRLAQKCQGGLQGGKLEVQGAGGRGRLEVQGGRLTDKGAGSRGGGAGVCLQVYSDRSEVQGRVNQGSKHFCSKKQGALFQIMTDCA